MNRFLHIFGQYIEQLRFLLELSKKLIFESCWESDSLTANSIPSVHLCHFVALSTVM